MSDPNDSTSTCNGVPLSLTFLEFCAKVRNNDPSILPELGQPFKIRCMSMSEKEQMELSEALLENNRVTYLELDTRNYTKSSAEAMANYVRSSKRLERIEMPKYYAVSEQHYEETLCCFLLAIQESTSLIKELQMNFLIEPVAAGMTKSDIAFEHMLTHTQSLRSLHLNCQTGPGDIHVAAARSGLEKNTTLQELTLDLSIGPRPLPILTSLCDHPLLRRLCLRGDVADVTGLETVLLSKNSKITELDINNSRSRGVLHMIGLSPVLRALAQHTTLTKLGLRQCLRGRDEASLLQMALCNMPSLQTLDMGGNRLGSAELAGIALALYHNTSIQVLDVSENNIEYVESAETIRDILRHNKTIITLVLSKNTLGLTTGAVECIADGLCSNSTLLKIDFSRCRLKNDDVSALAHTLGSRNTTLQKLTLAGNSITCTGVGVLLETMEQCNNHPITDLDLGLTSIRIEGAIFIARSLENNALPNLTSLSLCNCEILDDGFIALVSALEHNTSLLQLNLRSEYITLSKPAFLGLAESLPKIKVLQRLDLSWCQGLASAIPLLLEGLRINTSLFRLHVAGCASSSVPPSTFQTNQCAGGWMQEMGRLGSRNWVRTMIRAPKERRPPHGIWIHALARVATFPDAIFEVLRSKPNLVPSGNTEMSKEEAATDTGIPKKRKLGKD
jgi:Ran GTPase-activating protein (RanGAP) involved in mRNA processing and transport